MEGRPPARRSDYLSAPGGVDPRPVSLAAGRGRTISPGHLFEAIARRLPLRSVGYENETNERGERLIWLEPCVLDRAQGHARAGARATAM